MAEPPEDLYERAPWLWDCSEDYSDDPSTHERCIALKKRGGKQ